MFQGESLFIFKLFFIVLYIGVVASYCIICGVFYLFMDSELPLNLPFNSKRIKPIKVGFKMGD